MYTMSFLDTCAGLSENKKKESVTKARCPCRTENDWEAIARVTENGKMSRGISENIKYPYIYERTYRQTKLSEYSVDLYGEHIARYVIKLDVLRTFTERVFSHSGMFLYVYRRFAFKE